MYNRLFTKILDSSIWLEPTTTRIVWITLLAAMDEDGYAHFSAIENLAARARVTKAAVEKAIECFESPDPSSENTNHEGRRIERIPGGFLILNANEHRQKLNREIQKEKTRLRVAKYRERRKNVTKSVTSALPNVTSASASASECTKEGDLKGKPPNLVPTFEDIYQAYPRKVGKKSALRAIRSANQCFGAAFLLERTMAYAKTQPPNDRFTPYPATWFNDHRFNDAPETWTRDEVKPKSAHDEKIEREMADAQQSLKEIYGRK